MLTRVELRKIARARIKDSQALFRARRYDGAVYLCGYAIEPALKARICRTLGWPGFPSTGGEFKGLEGFKIHRLEMLLHLSGRASSIKAKYMVDWSIVAVWDEGLRYKPIGSADRLAAQKMIQSAETLLRAL